MRPSDFLFLATLTVVPLQLGKFFFWDESYVFGIPIDYRAATLYASDLVIILYFAVFLIENFKHLKKIYLLQKNLVGALLFLNLYLIVSSFFSPFPQTAFFTSFKILQFSLLAIFASGSFANQKLQKFAPNLLAFSLIWQSLVIIGQFLAQRSLGLWILGERAISPQTPAIAQASIFARLLLRPYGTFPHPNLAAAYLLVFAILYLIYNTRSKAQIIRIITIFLSCVSILITYSQGALLAAASALLVRLNLRQYLVIFLATVTAGVAITLKVISESQLSSIAERLTLAQAALDMASKNLLFGVGTNNFIAELANFNLYSIAQIRLLQPVHNVFLLILVENGLVGLMLFGLILFVVSQKAKDRVRLALFMALLVFLSVDHFLWTLQQGRFLLAIIIGFIVSDYRRL